MISISQIFHLRSTISPFLCGVLFVRCCDFSTHREGRSMLGRPVATGHLEGNPKVSNPKAAELNMVRTDVLTCSLRSQLAVSSLARSQFRSSMASPKENVPRFFWMPWVIASLSREVFGKEHVTKQNLLTAHDFSPILDQPVDNLESLCRSRASLLKS